MPAVRLEEPGFGKSLKGMSLPPFSYRDAHKRLDGSVLGRQRIKKKPLSIPVFNTKRLQSALNCGTHGATHEDTVSQEAVRQVPTEARVESSMDEVFDPCGSLRAQKRSAGAPSAVPPGASGKRPVR